MKKLNMKEKALKLLKDTSIVDKLIAVPYYLELLKKYNKLQSDYELLEYKTEKTLLEDYLNKVVPPEEYTKLEEENKELRTKIKELREERKNL